MIEFFLGLIFLSFILAPFSFGSLVSDTEIPSIGLVLLVLAYIAYFHGIFLPLPSIINKGLIASFAIVDSIFLIFFGLDIAAFGAQNLLIFLISLSVSYSILHQVFSSIPTLSDRAKEFITLAVLFVIARTTAVGQISLIYSIGVGLVYLLFPDCGAMSINPLYQMGFGVVGIVMMIFAAVGLSGMLRMLLLAFGLFWAFMPTFTSFLLGIPAQSFQFCVYYWVLQMAMVLFLFNWVFQSLAMDWMGGLVMQVTGGRRQRAAPKAPEEGGGAEEEAGEEEEPEEAELKGYYT